MADTIGDIFARSFRSGRAIGEDFSSMRYQRGEEKIRQKYTELAKSEGKNLEDYRGQIQTDLDNLYRTSGAKKRNLRDDAGNPLSSGSLASYDKRALDTANVRAGEQARAGDIAGSRSTLANTNFATGNYDAGIQNRQASDIIGASTAAIGKGPNGQYDAAGAAGAMSGIQARYGNMEGAIGAQQKSEGFRFEAAAGLAGQMAMMLDNPGQFADKITGLWEGLKQYLPEVGNIDVRVANGVPIIYTNGKATGSLDTPEEVEQVKSMLASITRDPKSVLPAWAQQRLTEAQHQRERREKLTDDTNAAIREVIKDFKSSGGDAAAKAAQGLVDAQAKASQQGWKFASARDDGAIPATFGNRAFLILPPQPAGEDGTPGFQSRVIDAVTGQTVNPQELGQQGAAIVEYSLQLGELMSQRASAMSREDLRFKIDLLNQVGGANPPSAGGAFPFKETDDYVRNILSKTGPLTGDARAQAKQLMAALVQQESGGNHGAISVKGARGVTQVMPATGKDPGFGVRPIQNSSREEYLRFGEDYLTAMLERYGDPALALAAYNAGPGQVDEWMQSGQAGRRTAAAPAPNQSPVQLPSAPPSRVASAPQQGISPQSLLQTRDQMLAAQDELQRWNTELQKFDQSRGTQRSPIFSRGTDAITGYSSNLSPDDARLRERLVAAVEQAKQKFDALLGMTRQGTRALNEQTASRGIDTQFAQIQQRVAGGDAASQTAATNPNGNPVLDSIIRQTLR